MKTKKLLALLLTVYIILTAGPFDIFIDIFAGLSPYNHEYYGKGTYSDPADYRPIHIEVFRDKEAVAPTAKFSVVNKADNSIIGTSSDDDTVTIVEDIPVGTVIKINNLSSKGSGSAIDMVDFQVTKDNSQVSSIQAAPVSLNSYELTLSSTGTYKFYLCVRDNTVKVKTDNWGNWSYNGAHSAIGLNYGINGSKETTGTPETAGGDDFWGLWYFAQVVVKVAKSPPVPDFTISYKGSNVTDNRTSPATIDSSNKSLVLVDRSQPYSPADPITGRKWYYWNVNNKWTEIAGSENKTTVNIANMDTTLAGSGINKAFKLVCTSSTGAEAYKEHTAYFKAAPPPPPPGKADIFVYYRDKSTGIDVAPPDETTYRGISYGTYSIAAPVISGYTLDASTPSPKSVTVDAANASVIVTFYYNSQGGGPSGNKPPHAIITGPVWKYAGEEFTVDGRSSFDEDGEIVQYLWDAGDAIVESNNGNRMRIWYEEPDSEKEIELTVVDDGGDSDSTSHDVEIREPIPTVVLKVSGTFKENRKVVLDAQDCFSPEHYPINLKLWTINNAADMKSKTALNGNLHNEVLFKVARSYSPKITVKNTYGLSASDQKTFTIVQDKSPIANFASSVKLLREPDNSNIATITISNLSSSPDGDPIKKTVMFYGYDSDNDGNFDEEVWKYSTNGTTWQNVGLPYSQIKTDFDIYSIPGGNPLNFVIKTNQVGKIKAEAMVIEDIPAATTIPELLTPADYKRGDTFSSKPNSEKIIDVINTAPQITFEAKKKKEVDILIATDYTGQKLANLQGALNVQKAALLAGNIDVKYSYVGQGSVAHIDDELNIYRRYGYYSYTADYDHWTAKNGSSGDDDEDYEREVLWEERQALESEYYYLPARNPKDITFTESDIIKEEDDDGDIDKYYNVTIRCTNDIKTSGIIRVPTYSANFNNDGDMTMENEWSDFDRQRVRIDKTWLLDDKISDVLTDIKSVDFGSLGSIPLRENSDRYMLMIGDTSAKKWSTGWGTYFPFGGLTDNARNYVKANNINPYIVSPPSTLDATIGPDKATEVHAGDVVYYKALDGTMKIIIDKGYPVDVNLGGDIKEVYGKYVLLTNGTLKYRSGGANYVTVASGVTKIIDEYDDYGRTNDLWICTSDGKVSRVLEDSIEFSYSLPNAVSAYSFRHVDLDSDFEDDHQVYILSTTTSTYLVNNTGQSKLLYNSALVGYFKANVSDTNRDPVIFVFKNGYFMTAFVSMYESKGNIIIEVEKDALLSRLYDEEDDEYYYRTLTGFTPHDAYTFSKDGILYEIGTNDVRMDRDDDRNYFYYIILDNCDEGEYLYDTVAEDARKYKDGRIEVPCTFNARRYSNGKWYETTITKYAFVDALKNRTITRCINIVGTTLILDSEGNLYRWYDPNVYSGSSPSPDSFPFVLVSDNASELLTLSSVSDIYYVLDGQLKDAISDAVIFDVIDTEFEEFYYSKQLLIVTADGKLYKYGEGTSGSDWGDLIKSRPVINDTTQGYIPLRDIMNSIPSTKYFTAGQYAAAVQDITNIYLNDVSYTTNYILVNDEMSYTTAYSDYENDVKSAEEWKLIHEPYWFDNSMGIADFHGQTLTAPVTRYTKKGRYTINLRARDNPKNDPKFKNDTDENYNYWKWSTGNQNVLLYVHEKPIALARVTITNNGNDTFTVKAFDAGSYDPDHSNSRADKGIAAREWRWKEAASTAWTNGQMNKADCTADKSYIIQLRVKDIEGVWSDYHTITIDKNNPPAALFNLDKTLIRNTDLLKVKDQSFPQSFSSITAWHWVVKKLNADGSVPAANLQNQQFTTSNNGTGTLAGYDANVKTNYSTNGVGTFRVYLRVKDSNGLWSDGGTNSTTPVDLSKYYSMDFDVDKAPTPSFTVANSLIKPADILKVRDTTTTTGISGIAKWHWIVKKLNSDGSVPSTNLQSEIFTNSNTGTGALAGYDSNVITDYSAYGTGVYRIYLRACNGNGMWSDGGADAAFSLGSFFYRDIAVDSPPTASFTITQNPIEPAEKLKLKDTSAVTGISPINRWHWIVKRLNEDGSVPAASLQDMQYSTHNAGTGELAGCDANVKTDYSDSGPGTYRIYLRVRNANGMWSDGGDDKVCNPDKFFQRELLVRESFKISNFRVVKVRDLHLESFYYNPSTGQYDDRPMDVNYMAVDRHNFDEMVEGLTKGYSFEFEIDTINFNGNNDAIIITPHFYTCDSYGRDPEERELYWENSYHEILKAGEGGHEAWADIRLGKESRSIKDGNKATWRGSYLIPGTAWAVPMGTSAENAVSKRISKDIIVSFEIKGYKDGVMKYDYNLKQWPAERVTVKQPYEIGDVIRYDYTKCNLDDNKVILNRP